MSSLSDSVLRSYLLGQLAPADREQLRASIASDPGLLGRLDILEDELIDEYIAGSLTPEDLFHFEANFLNTAEKREKVEFAESMHRTLNAPDRPASARTRWIVIAASIALATALVGWFAMQNRRTTQTAGLRQDLSVLDIRLHPGSTRDMADGLPSTLRITNASRIRFHLIQIAPPPAAVTATIRQSPGQILITTRVQTQPDTSDLLVDAPTSRLNSGDFEIVLTAPDGLVFNRYFVRLTK